MSLQTRLIDAFGERNAEGSEYALDSWRIVSTPDGYVFHGRWTANITSPYDFYYEETPVPDRFREELDPLFADVRERVHVDESATVESRETPFAVEKRERALVPQEADDGFDGAVRYQIAAEHYLASLYERLVGYLGRELEEDTYEGITLQTPHLGDIRADFDGAGVSKLVVDVDGETHRFFSGELDTQVRRKLEVAVLNVVDLTETADGSEIEIAAFESVLLDRDSGRREERGDFTVRTPVAP